MIKKLPVLALSFFSIFNAAKAIAQQPDSAKGVDLFADMEKESKAADKNNTDYTIATFKSTRVINGQSVETIGKHHLDFRIAHRFGPVNSGAEQFFGLDNATMKLSFDFGLTDNLLIGVGRSTVDKEYDGYVKYKFLRQSEGKKNFPVTLAYFGAVSITTQKTSENLKADERMAFVNQLLIARKFNEVVSLQLSPTIVHWNMVDYKKESNTLFSLGIGGRVKISKRVAITGEYFHQFDKLTGRNNALSFGFDIETGGHVFQLHFSNSQGISERSFITNTKETWGDGGIHFGFNISRIFSFAKAKDSKGW